MEARQLISGETLVEISNDFDYMHLIEKEHYWGLTLFPLFKTKNMKLAMYNLMDGADIPVMSFVHAFDTEARIGDRPNYQEFKYELLLIKEKIKQGEEIKKKLDDIDVTGSEKEFLTAIYNDISNLISRIITRMEVMAAELLSTGKVTIKENDVNMTVDYQLPESHEIGVVGWELETADIIGDLVNIKATAKNKIKRALVPEKIMGYMLKNTAIKNIAASYHPIQYATQEWVLSYLQSLLNIEFNVTSGTYKKDLMKDSPEYYFFKQDVITFLTTEGEVGKTFVTTTPEEDYGIADYVNGYVAITQYKTEDPAGIWTKASAVALPCPANINSIYLCTVSETPEDDEGP